MRKEHIALWLFLGLAVSIVTGLLLILLQAGVAWSFAVLRFDDPTTGEELSRFVQFLGVTLGVSYVIYRTFAGAFNVDLTLEGSLTRTTGKEVLVSVTMKKGTSSGLLIRSMWTRFRPATGAPTDWEAVDPETYLEVSLDDTAPARSVQAAATPEKAEAEPGGAAGASVRPGITISPGETYNLAFKTVLAEPELAGVLDVLVVAERAPVRMGTPSQWRLSIPLPPRRASERAESA